MTGYALGAGWGPARAGSLKHARGEGGAAGVEMLGGLADDGAGPADVIDREDAQVRRAGVTAHVRAVGLAEVFIIKHLESTFPVSVSNAAQRQLVLL